MAKPPQSPTAQPELEDEDGSLRRGSGDRGLSLSEKLAAGLTSRLYASPLHSFRLRGRFPLKLLAAPADPVPGDPHIGERIIAGRLIHAGHTQMTRDINFREAGPPPEWLEWAHGWEWLRDLAILPDREAARRAAENLVERWFRELTEKAIRRGTFTHVDELIAAIQKYMDAYNEEPKPFIWTATAESIMEKITKCKAIYETLH